MEQKANKQHPELSCLSRAIPKRSTILQRRHTSPARVTKRRRSSAKKDKRYSTNEVEMIRLKARVEELEKRLGLTEPASVESEPSIVED